MAIVCILLAYFLAYGVFKSNGVWTAAYLHALNNQALQFFAMALVASNVFLSDGVLIAAIVPRLTFEPFGFLPVHSSEHKRQSAEWSHQ